jgi:uncharacterized membrane protein
MLQGFRFAAILSCSLFAGAALYINLAEHPARMECGTALAATVFGPSYKRAAVMQAALATVASACGAACWLLSNSALWLLGAALIFLVIPFTLIVIFPTNKRLLDPGLNRNSAQTHELLARWGKLHAVRTLVSLTATAVFLIAALRS